MKRPVNPPSKNSQVDPNSVEAGLSEIQDALNSKGIKEDDDDAWEDDDLATDDDKSPEDDALDVTQREMKARVEDRKKGLEQREKEARDRRSQLLKAVRISAPEINKPLVETFERLSLENHEFAQKELVRLFKNDAQLQNSLDFFDLNLAQREDLLDRIGFYKGIVIDHSLSNPVETGFREVLKRERHTVEDEDDEQNPIATILYRKPNFSGYHENYFTSSESLHQVQKNGVTDIKSSLNVAGGKLVTVGVGASGAYYDAEGSNGGGKEKKVYITANFFLPKVELSFDDSKSCASAEFEAACQEALSELTEEARFSALVSVLGSFGQFVSTQTLVGGRLFATDVKELKDNESVAEMTTRYAGALKVAVDSVTASFESDTTAQHGKQTNNRGQDLTEKQTYTIHAVGGEGTVVEQPGRWAESLYEYQRWSAVQREKLIPSIQLLSKNLRLHVWETLKSFAAKNSAMHLVGKYNAYFLFYGDYDAQVGQQAKRDIVVFRNAHSQHCLAIQGETPQNGGVTGKLFDWTPQILWRVTPNRNIVSAVPVSSGFPGKKKTVDFALKVLAEVPKDGQSKPETLPVGLAELKSEAKQTWEFTGRGELFNVAFGEAYALSMHLDNKPVLRLRKQDAIDNTMIWSAQEASHEDIEKMAARKVYGCLVLAGGLVLSIEGGEDSNNPFSLSDRRRLLMQPYNGGKHQLWHLRADGTLVSAITIGSNNAAMTADVYLTLSSDQKIVAQGQGITPKIFKCDENLLVYTMDDAKQTLYASAIANDGTSGQRVTAVMDKRLALKFEKIPAGTGPVAYSLSVPSKITTKCFRLKAIDKRELKVDGYLTGIKFILEERHKNTTMKAWEFFRMRMYLFVMRKTGPDEVELADEPEKVDSYLDFISDNDGYSDVRIDDRMLLLPEEPIYSIRLRLHEKPVKRLALEYRKTENGPWIGLSNTNDQAKLVNVNMIGVSTQVDEQIENGSKVLGIGLDYDPLSNFLRPKLLRRIIA